MSSANSHTTSDAARQLHNDAREALRSRREKALKELDEVSRLEAELNRNDEELPSGCGDGRIGVDEVHAGIAPKIMQNGDGNPRRSFVADHEMTADEVVRYSRQMILPSFGVDGELQCAPAHSIIARVLIQSP